MTNVLAVEKLRSVYANRARLKSLESFKTLTIIAAAATKKHNCVAVSQPRKAVFIIMPDVHNLSRLVVLEITMNKDRTLVL